MTNRARILVVDDDPFLCQLLDRELTAAGYAVRTAPSAEQALVAIEEQDVDAVLTDLDLGGGMDGHTLCSTGTRRFPDLPFMVVTVAGTVDAAVRAMRAGAYDFVTKPIQRDTLLMSVRRAVEHGLVRREVRQLRRAARSAERFEDLIGDSEAMHAVYDLLARGGGTDDPVLLTGESGTGKELAARAIHRRSRRTAGPFLSVDCAILPEALLSDELFGHARGTGGAQAARRGLLAEAAGGTLFLDGIAELSLTLQGELFRVLSERTVRPAGGAKAPFEARLITATSTDLEAAVADKRFRADLYQVLRAIHVELPPLRARANDVLLIAQHLLITAAARAGKEVGGFTPEAAGLLRDYPWPGNVRELASAIERAVTIASGEQVTESALPARIREHRATGGMVVGESADDLVPLAELERRYILHALRVCGGNRSTAARWLGVDRTTLYRKLLRYGVGEGE